MMYEAYEKKVRGYIPLAKALKICVKGAIVLLILAVISLLGVLVLRGIHFGDYTLSQQTVAFGDKPEYDCFVLFGTYQCEYAKPGSQEWSKEQPTTPGEYNVRAVIRRGFFGRKVYSEVETLTIYRRDVTLYPSNKLAGAVPYGEDPVYGKHWEIPASLLAKGHTVKSAKALRYEYDGRGGMTVYVDAGSVVIHDRKGNDVTDGYVLSGGSDTIKVKAKTITVVVSDEIKNGKPVNITKTYDGQSAGTSKYHITQGELLSGDTIEVVATSTATDAGRHDNSASVTISNRSGQSRTSYYNIKLDVCKIVIEKRPLTVSTPDMTVEYSGAMQYNEQYTIKQGSLAPGQTASLVFNNKTGFSDVTSRPAENKVQLQIFADGREVTRNYEISYEFGSLTVTPRSLRVRTTDSYGLVYNGQAQKWTEYEIVSGSLGAGHRLSPKKASELTEPGSCTNEVEYEVLSSDGKNVTKNYTLSVDYGTLSIEKGAPLSLALKDLSKTYDSRPLDPDDYEASALVSVVGGTLHGSDYIEIVSTEGSQTDVGSSAYRVQYRIMHKQSMGKAVDATSWYASNLTGEGSLRVTPYTVTLKFDPITKQYDGKATVPSEPDLSVSALSSFADGGHKIVLASGAMQMLQYTKGGRQVPEAVDIGSYSYSIPMEYVSVVTKNGSADRTSNYRFEISGNSIKIEGVTLSLTAPDATKQYDGMPLSADQFSKNDVTVKWGAQGYSVSYVLTGAQTDVGTGSVGFTNIAVTDANGRDVTINFDIKTTSGKLTVTPVEITVRSAGGNKVYDGLPMDNATQLTLVSGRLVEGHVLGGSIGANYVTDVGTHENDQIAPKVYAATGADVTRNYKITLTAGTYTITQAQLSLFAPVVEGEYTGQSYSGTCDATASALGLAKGQRVELDVVSSGIELGRHSMQITGYRIRNARGADVSANYKVTLSDGQLDIVPRKILVMTGNQTVAYQNAPAVNTQITVGKSGLLKGHEVRATFTYPDGLAEIGTVTNTLENVKIVDANGRDVSRYYDVTYQYGSLRVNPIEITLETESAYKEMYDGAYISAPGYTQTKGELLSGHTLQVQFEHEVGVCDVGTWKNGIRSVRVTDRSGRDVSYMYNVNVIEGTLQIEKPYRLHMTSESASKTYDGLPLSCDIYTLENELPSGHRINGIRPITQTRAGEVENRLTLIIVNNDGRDVSKNFEFYYAEGAVGYLTILPKPLSVTIGHVEPSYNGTSTLNVPLSQLLYEGLVTGDSISVTVEVDSPEIGAKARPKCNAPRIYNASGADVTDCYEISTDSSALSVNVLPADLLLYLPDRYSKEYDGQGLDAQGVGYRAMGLASGHYVEYTATETAAEPGTYTVEFTSYAVFDKNGNDVTSNYQITANSCAVTIHKKYIKLTSESASRHYNGQELTCHELKKYTLNGGYWLDVSFTGSQTEVGVSQNSFTVRVFDANGNDVTQYCNVSYSYGTLEVWGQITLKLKSGDALKIYDGTPLTCHELSDYTLPAGYWLEVTFTGERTLAGESDNTFDVVIYGPDGDVATQSFIVEKEYGTLKVLESAEDFVLTLTSKSASKTYDGEALTLHELEPYELPDGFMLDVSFTGSQTAIGSSENTFTARAYNAAGRELTVVCEYGTLEVSLNITVNAYEMTFTYDGTEKNCRDGDFWTQGLPEGFSVEVTFGEGLTVTGTKNVEIESVRVFDRSGTDVTDICNVTVNTAKLTVLPRVLTVYVYGQSADSITPVQGSLVEGHTMFAEYGEGGECFIEITDASGTLVYSNRGDSPIRYVLYDVIIQY